jgi:DNA repair photolyase
MKKAVPTDRMPGRVIKRKRRTKFVEIFRTTPTDTVCPNFYVLSHANGCTFAPLCTYCYLKSSFWYLARPQVFTNAGQMLDEVAEWIGTGGLETYMLNTGNLSDSLGFEKDRPIVKKLIELFRNEAEAKGKKHTLLLVTKGGRRECQSLLESKPCNNVIVSFSVNNPEAARQYEGGAASVAERMATAKELKSLGWRVRIRIDPMIAGFDYAGILEQVAQLEPERVTLGTLRADRALPRYVNEGLFAELEPPVKEKGLARYPKSTRLALYRSAIKKLKDIAPIGLCEETPDIWEALGLDTEAKQCNCCL